MARALINVPASAKRGEVIEIKTLISHPMQPGYRPNSSGEIQPRDIINRKSLANAVAIVMATGGSTNAVLHFLAIAKAAGVRWDIDDFEKVARRTPVICDLKPSGRFVAVDFDR